MWGDEGPSAWELVPRVWPDREERKGPQDRRSHRADTRVSGWLLASPAPGPTWRSVRGPCRAPIPQALLRALVNVCFCS